MAALHRQHLDPPHTSNYPLPPAPHQLPMYPPHPPPDPYGQSYHTPQTAPRQRTAIACRYCRRRKIRCSGFESSEDGKCQNCQRFNQDCIFTPVSTTHTQAFVPFNAVYRTQTLGEPVRVYGAHGQPLPPQHAFPQQARANLSPGQLPYNGYYGDNSQQYMRGPTPQTAPAPLVPGQGYAQSYDDRGPRDPRAYQTSPVPTQPQYYDYRSSSSPHSNQPGVVASNPPGSTYAYPPPPVGRTPPPLNPHQPPPGPPQRSGISINSLVSPDGASPGARSATDSDMLNRLSRP